MVFKKNNSITLLVGYKLRFTINLFHQRNITKELSNEMQFLAISLNSSIICIKCNRLKVKKQKQVGKMFLCVPKSNKTHHHQSESNPFSFLFSSYISFSIVCNDVLRLFLSPLLCMPFWLANNNQVLSCL